MHEQLNIPKTLNSDKSSFYYTFKREYTVNATYLTFDALVYISIINKNYY